MANSIFILLSVDRKSSLFSHTGEFWENETGLSVDDNIYAPLPL